MIRSYKSEDKTKLIDLLKLNIPRYFDEAEENDFIEYLANHAKNYYVIEENRQIIGSGGINYFAELSQARISWDIIHPDFHGKGIGTKLILFRINQIKKNPEINLISVRTTQLVYKFYQKNGFVLEKVVKDYWAKGFDLYKMTLKLN